MKGSVIIEVEAFDLHKRSVIEAIRLESLSAPSGGTVDVDEPSENVIRVRMTSEDPSKLRAMMNSYLGLLSVAMKAAGR